MAQDEIDTSLRTEELFKPTAERMSSKEISIDLDNMLQEIQDERDSDQLKWNAGDGSNSSSSNSSISLGLIESRSNNHENDLETDDLFETETTSPQHIGSELRLEDLPSVGDLSSPKAFDSWWSSGSSTFKGSFMGSFRKRMGSSLRKIPYYHRRRKDAPANTPTEEDEAIITPPTTAQQQQQQEDHDPPRRKKKAVRFKKFDTVFPFYKSFSRLHRQLPEDERSYD